MDLHPDEGLQASEDTGVWLKAGGDTLSYNEAGGQRVKGRTRTLSLGWIC